MDNRSYTLKKALSNKMMDENGNIKTMSGDIVFNSVVEYNNRPALPNKFLNPDGSYSTLNEILAGIVDVDLFVPVETLPEIGDPKKIYLVPNGKGTFDEYHYDDTLNKWDPFGVLDISNLVTTDQLKAALVEAKQYVDQEISKIVPLYPFPESFSTDGTTEEFIDSIVATNPPVGAMYLGICRFTDMPDAGLRQADVKVEVYRDDVLYLTMSSADISPYEWKCCSYAYRGWEPSGIQAAKDYTDEQIQEKVTQVLGGEY